MSANIKVGSKVSYTDQYGERVGEVIELRTPDPNAKELWPARARIKWEGRKLRTWIRLPALKLIGAIIAIILFTTSCHKSIDNPPAPPEPIQPYHLVVRCVNFKRDTLRLRGMVIPRWLCTKTIIDTVKH